MVYTFLVDSYNNDTKICSTAEVTADIHPDVRRSKRATIEHENRLRSVCKLCDVAAQRAYNAFCHCHHPLLTHMKIKPNAKFLILKVSLHDLGKFRGNAFDF